MPRSSTRESKAPAVFEAGQGGGMGTSTKAPTTPPCLSRVEDKQEMTPKDRTKTKAADQTTERAAGKKKRIIAKFVAMDNRDHYRDCI